MLLGRDAHASSKKKKHRFRAIPGQQSFQTTVQGPRGDFDLRNTASHRRGRPLKVLTMWPGYGRRQLKRIGRKKKKNFARKLI